MSATAKDETFEITDKNFRKVAENLEKVKISISICLFGDDVTFVFSRATQKESPTDGLQCFKDPSTMATKTGSE